LNGTIKEQLAGSSSFRTRAVGLRLLRFAMVEDDKRDEEEE
jgi:hypothetical protein